MENNEYIIQLNENDSYDLILGNKDIKESEINNIIEELKANNVIPTDAIVNTYIYDQDDTPEIKENGQKIKKIINSSYQIMVGFSMFFFNFNKKHDTISLEVQYND